MYVRLNVINILLNEKEICSYYIFRS